MKRLTAYSLAGLMASALAVTAASSQDAPASPPATPAATSAEITVVQEFYFDQTSRLTVPVRINGSEPFPFIVDTGAERTIIAHDLALQLALEAGKTFTLATITGRSETGSFLIDHLATSAVSVDGLEAPALLRSNLGAYGLLGIDSLEGHRVLIDFRHNKMDVMSSELSRKKTKLERDMIVVTATRRAGRMILSNAKIDGIKVDIILDTGAQSSMGNIALKSKLKSRHMRRDFTPAKVRSVTGDFVIGDFTQIKRIEIGGILLQDLPITFSDNYAFDLLGLTDRPAMLLGMDSLKLFDRVMIDFVNRRVGFDMPAGINMPPAVHYAWENPPSSSRTGNAILGGR